jgi:peptide/nickel transport system substrate-binding protein
MWQQLNDLVVNDYADVPLVDRKSVAAKAKSLTGPDLRAFDNETWNIADWKKG